VLPAIGGEVWTYLIDNQQTINARIATYGSALAMFADHPVFGVGFGTFDEVWDRFPERYYKEYKGEPSVPSPHNIFMALLAETGFVGVFAFGMLVFQIFRTSLRLAKSNHGSIQRDYALFITSVMAAYLVTGMGLHIIRNLDFINKYLFMFIGILSGILDGCALDKTAATRQCIERGHLAQ